jgi:WD40 repeat protein
VIDSASGETVSTFRVGKAGITSLIFDSDESWLACAMGTNNDAGLKIYSASRFSGSWSPRNSQSGVSTEPIASIPLAGIRELCLSDDERYLFAGLISGEIAVIDTETWTVNGRWKGHEQEIYALDTRGPLLVSGGSDGWVQCWNTDTRQLVCEWKAHALRISDLKLHPNAARVYTASFDETTTIWSLDGNLLS